MADDVGKRDQPLQAVVLVDCFSSTFNHLAKESSKQMAPVVNVAMINYSIRFLIQNGAKEIFICSYMQPSGMERTISNALSDIDPGVSIRCISSVTWQSPGDVLRQIFRDRLIQSDLFILVTGDLIANVDITDAIAFHKQKVKQDNEAIMTVLLKKMTRESVLKPTLDDLVVSMDENSQIVYWVNNFRNDTVTLPVQILMEHPSVTTYTDHFDCHIDICSQEVLGQFDDMFDYQDIRKDFLTRETVNFELGKHFYSFIVEPNQFAARVQDAHSLHAVTQALANRWCPPFLPDSQVLHSGPLSHFGRNRYKEGSVDISESAEVCEGVLLGRGTSVASGAILRRSSIGRNCRIGAGCRIDNSVIGDDVTIDENCNVTESVLGARAILQARVVLPRGCMVAAGAVVEAGTIVAEFTKIVAATEAAGTGSRCDADEDEEDDEEGDSDDGSGEEDDGDDAVTVRINVSRAGLIGCREERVAIRDLWKTRPGRPTDSDDEDDDGQGAGEDFCSVVKEFIVTGFTDKHATANVVMEVKGLKFSANKSFSDCVRGAVSGLISIAAGAAASSGPASSGGAGPVFSSKVFLEYSSKFFGVGGWGYEVLRALTLGEAEQATLIESIEAELIAPRYAATVYGQFAFVFKFMYDAELIGDSAVQAWIKQRRDEVATGGLDLPTAKLFMQHSVVKLVEWLTDDSDEEEDDDDDDDDED